MMGREDYPAAKLVHATVQGLEGIFLVGMECLCRVSIPAKVLGARVTALLRNLIPVRISRGWTVNLLPQKREFGIELWKYVTWEMKRVVLQQFSPTEMSMTERAMC